METILTAIRPMESTTNLPSTKFEAVKMLAKSMGWELRKEGTAGYRLFNHNHYPIYSEGDLNYMIYYMAKYVERKISK